MNSNKTVKLYGIVGSGGHGRETAPLAERWLRGPDGPGDGAEVVFVVEDNYFVSSDRINGRRVLRMSEFLAVQVQQRYFNIAIADSRVRERIANSIAPELALPFSVVAETHVRLDCSTVGEGAIFSSFSHLTSNSCVGRFFHANFYSYVAHDCVIGDFVTFGPGAKCNGHVVIEDHAYIGAGAVIRDGTQRPMVIGKGAVVGMGAVVTRSVPAGATVVGNPAKILRR
jgi:sugar O-acyltransferase (sialic acid O-acetyltransferase NeuD family)